MVSHDCVNKSLDLDGSFTDTTFVDFIKQDVSRLYRDLLPCVKITLVEAGPALLGPFDAALQNYTHGLFQRRDVDVRLGTAVTGVEDFEAEGYHFSSRRAVLTDGTKLEFGTMVWSAGLAPRAFTEHLDGVIEKHPRNKRILVDKYLRVKGYEGSIWACGDAAVNEEGIALPQVAQGTHFLSCLMQFSHAAHA
jgi:NADH dehydrogenase FAD-containing subunit